MLNIYIKDNNIEQTYLVNESENLLVILQDLGYTIKAYCGGNGCCGKCSILVNNERMLACKTHPTVGMRINLCLESQDINANKINVNHNMGINDICPNEKFNDCNITDNNNSLYEKKENSFAKELSDSNKINESNISAFYETNESNFINNISVLNETNDHYVLNSDKVNDNKTNDLAEKFFLTIDLGTTTIAIALVSSLGAVLDVVNFSNPQSSFGADVISRIKAVTEGKLKKINTVLIDKLNEKFSQIKLKNSVENIVEIYVSGNTTMLHILFNIDCSSMGLAPYDAQFLIMQEKNCNILGINEKCNIISLPNISSFVGSDITSGIYYLGEPNKEKYNILLDLGTNAEIALWSCSQHICTAAAAGPCFEGANITCGISSTDGAINAFKIIDSKNTFTTISNKNAVGICGTGLIDIISELKDNEIIEESGVFVDNNNYYLTDNIFLSQKDVREFQLAKSAICSALETLLIKLNINFDDVESFYIAGGFSSFVNIKNAINIGLIPSAVKEKCKVVANSSLKGCIKYCLEKGNISKLAKEFTYIDLSTDSNFNSLFVENMMIESK